MKKYYCPNPDCGWIGTVPFSTRTVKKDNSYDVTVWLDFCPECREKLTQKDLR
jgi:hypothetical protein